MRVRLSSRVYYRTIASGVFHCERCGGDRPYRHRTGRRWAQLLGLPVVPLENTGDHLRCTICRTCYRVELLAVPTVEQMQAALRNAATAAALAMLWAGGSDSEAARRRAVELIVGSGSPGYSEPDLLTQLEGTQLEGTQRQGTQLQSTQLDGAQLDGARPEAAAPPARSPSAPTSRTRSPRSRPPSARSRACDQPWKHWPFSWRRTPGSGSSRRLFRWD